MNQPRKMTKNEKLIRDARSFRQSNNEKYLEIGLANALEKADAEIENLKISLVAAQPIFEHNIYMEVEEAFHAGLIEQWLEAKRPKTMKEWEAYEAKFPRGTFFWDKKDSNQ